MVASFREFQKRNGLPTISQDLEDAIVETQNYEMFIHLLKEAFPSISTIETTFFSSKKSLFLEELRDPIMVKRGLHPFRRWAAEHAHLKRLEFSNNKRAARAFMDMGFVHMPNIVTSEELPAIVSEFQAIPPSVNKQSFNLIEALAKDYPKTYEVHEAIERFVMECVGKTVTAEMKSKYNWNTFMQKVVNRPHDNDNQKRYHVDTFFPAVKWWFFPEKVTAKDGAFWYASKTNLVSLDYMDWLYDQTIRIIEDRSDSWKGKDHIEGSFRASELEVANMSFEILPMTVEAGSLIIGNVAGFHRRGDTVQQSTRLALHGSIRLDNPFDFRTGKRT